MPTKTKSDLEYLLEILIEAGNDPLIEDIQTKYVSDFIFYCKRALQRKEFNEQKQQQEALNNAREFWNFKNTK